MRVLIGLWMVAIAANLSAQTVEHWWLPVHFSKNKLNALTLHESPNGIICLSTDDSVYYPNPVLREKWSDLSISVIDANGGMYSQLMRSIGPFTFESNSQEVGGFEYAVEGEGSARPLLATTSWSYFQYSTGSDYSSAAPLGLMSFADREFRSILDHPSGRKPALLRTKSGVAWMTWEAITASNPHPDFHDRHYRAEIRVARLSSDDHVEISYSLGPGYSPKLVERVDGTVFVLYRTADHSEARDKFSLRLTSLSGPGGGDAVVDDGLSIRYWWTPELQVLAGVDNSLMVLMDRIDSVVVYHCSEDAIIKRSAAPASGNEQQKYLLNDYDGRTLLLWRMIAGEDVVWSPLDNGKMFDTIRSIPGTASFLEWKAFSGQDGFVKFIAHPTGAGVLNIIPNATSYTPVMRELFSLDTFGGAVLDWHLDSKGALWIAHREEVSENRWRSGLYRIRDLSLPSKSPASLSEHVKLLPNFPNPFNPMTTIRFVLPRSMPVTLIITDVLGREVRRIIDGKIYPQGEHSWPFNADGLPSGLYFSHFIADDAVQIGRLVLLR
ncbi:MAG: hypothetical protein WC824_08325 [Bacteroidota bacterium]|jgi:hypothetical protein